MKRKLLTHCISKVNKGGIRRETINGVEHIVLTSFTLPANIVMNGILYSEEERNASFHTLERTLAPVEHPTDSDGNFMLANDPLAIHDFHVGAFNANVELDEATNRIKIDKFINPIEAAKSDKGKRLLDRVEEIENSDKPRPIHTSVALLLTKEDLDAPQTNAAGQEFTWIASDMLFDHDAILLDSVGAAQPNQGVGIGINAEGEQIDVQTFVFNEDDREAKGNDLRTFQENQMSFGEIEQKLHEKINAERRINKDAPMRWVAEVYNDHFIFEDGEDLLMMQYSIFNEEIQLMDFPQAVKREVKYIPQTNSEGNAMKEMIVNALKAAGIEVKDDATEAELFAAYNELQAQSNEEGGHVESNSDDNVTATIDAVNAAMAPLIAKIDGLETQINSGVTEEKSQMIEVVVNSDKYPSMTKEVLEKLSLDDVKSMAANCGVSHGLPISNGSDDDSGAMSFELVKEAS